MNKLPRMFKAYNIINEDGTVSMELRGSNNITYNEILNWYKKQKHKLDLDRYREISKKLQIIAYYYNSVKPEAIKEFGKKYYIYYSVTKNEFVISDETPLSPYQEYYYDILDAEEVLNNPNLRPIYDDAYYVNEPMDCPFE